MKLVDYLRQNDSADADSGERRRKRESNTTSCSLIKHLMLTLRNLSPVDGGCWYRKKKKKKSPKGEEKERPEWSESAPTFPADDPSLSSEMYRSKKMEDSRNEKSLISSAFHLQTRRGDYIQEMLYQGTDLQQHFGMANEGFFQGSKIKVDNYRSLLQGSQPQQSFGFRWHQEWPFSQQAATARSIMYQTQAKGLINDVMFSKDGKPSTSHLFDARNAINGLSSQNFQREWRSAHSQMLDDQMIAEKTNETFDSSSSRPKAVLTNYSSVDNKFRWKSSSSYNNFNGNGKDNEAQYNSHDPIVISDSIEPQSHSPIRLELEKRPMMKPMSKFNSEFRERENPMKKARITTMMDSIPSLQLSLSARFEDDGTNADGLQFNLEPECLQFNLEGGPALDSDLIGDIVHGGLRADNLDSGAQELSLRFEEVIQQRVREAVKKPETELQLSQKQVQMIESFSNSDVGSSNQDCCLDRPLCLGLAGDALDAYNEAREEFMQMTHTMETEELYFYQATSNMLTT